MTRLAPYPSKHRNYSVVWPPPLPGSAYEAFKARIDMTTLGEMFMSAQFIEDIGNAADSALHCLDDLRGAIGKASPLEALVLEDLLLRAAELSQKIARLRDTIALDD